MSKKYHSTVPELPLGEVNIIPIVDVSFCLVIFCLVAMNIMLTAGINVVHARAGAPAGRGVRLRKYQLQRHPQLST